MSIKKRLVFSSVSSSVLNTHTADHDKIVRLAKCIKHTENYSFICETRRRSKGNTKAPTPADMSTEKGLLSRVFRAQCSIHKLQDITETCVRPHISKHRKLQFHMCNEDSLKQNTEALTTACVNIQRKLLVSSVLSSVLNTNTALQKYASSHTYQKQRGL